jgi:hypothetical protein
MEDAPHDIVLARTPPAEGEPEVHQHDASEIWFQRVGKNPCIAPNHHPTTIYSILKNFGIGCLAAVG